MNETRPVPWNHMKSKPLESSVTLLTVVCFFAFFIFGFTDNLKGPTLPVILSELDFNYGIGGNILFGLYLGFLIATLITGILADRFGLKVVLLLQEFASPWGSEDIVLLHQPACWESRSLLLDSDWAPSNSVRMRSSCLFTMNGKVCTLI